MLQTGAIGLLKASPADATENGFVEPEAASPLKPAVACSESFEAMQQKPLEAFAEELAHPLSPELLAEFCDLLHAQRVDPEKTLRFIKIASSPTLSAANRASILKWIASKRAA